MNSELGRLASYIRFPVTVSRLRPTRLSRLGFYYDDATNCVVCHRCRFSADLTSVHDEHDLQRRHHQQSPTCRDDSDVSPETRDVIASRDLPTESDDAHPHATPSPRSIDARQFFSFINPSVREYIVYVFFFQN